MVFQTETPPCIEIQIILFKLRLLFHDTAGTVGVIQATGITQYKLFLQQHPPKSTSDARASCRRQGGMNRPVPGSNRICREGDSFSEEIE